MIEAIAVVGSSAIVTAATINNEYRKSQHMELTEEEKKQILEDKSRRFLHFTSEKSARRIIESGFFIPTVGTSQMNMK